MGVVVPVAFETTESLGHVTVASSMSELSIMVSNVMDVISGNQLLFTLWCASLFFVGIGIVKALKKAAKK